MNKEKIIFDRIIYISPSTIPSRSANSIHVINQCNALANHCSKVITFCASKGGRHVSDELDRYVDSFNRDFATPEDVGWTNGEDESPPDYPFSAFSWAEHSEQLSKLKGGSFVSRYIMGFEGKENDLVYINRQRNFSDFEENAELGRIFPSVSPRVSIDGVLIEASETTDLFKLASQLLPEEWI